MTSYSALDPVSSAVYSALNVPAVTALAPGGIGDDVSQRAVTPDVDGNDSGFPFVLYAVQERVIGGLGTKPGVRQLPQVDLTIHVFSKYNGMAQAQQVMNQVIGALADPPAVSGYSSWAIFHDDTINLGDQMIAGIKVKELVAQFRLYVELSA